jgi:hypothetical protein
MQRFDEVKYMTFPTIYRISCEELCRRRAELEKSLNNNVNFDIDRCVRICRELTGNRQPSPHA